MSKSKIDELIDRAEITDVVNSYFRALDEKHFDAQHFAAIFTAEAKATRPNGSSMIGPDEISASHARSFERFESSQHLVAGHDIAVSGNRATARANLVAMHMWQGSNTNANNVDNLLYCGRCHTRYLGATRWTVEDLADEQQRHLACRRI